MTSDWATDDFLASQILQALGQSFALTALIVLIVGTINPADALTIGALERAGCSGEVWHGVHADVRAHAGADPFQSDRPARGSAEETLDMQARPARILVVKTRVQPHQMLIAEYLEELGFKCEVAGVPPRPPRWLC